jgi:hypothetical protein
MYIRAVPKRPERPYRLLDPVRRALRGRVERPAEHSSAPATRALLLLVALSLAGWLIVVLLIDIINVLFRSLARA